MIEATSIPARIVGLPPHEVGTRALVTIGCLEPVNGRQGPHVLRPVHLGHIGGQVISLSEALQLFLTQAPRELRTDILLNAIQPDREQGLVDAALVPVTLLVIFANASDAGTGRHRDHCDMGWMILCRQAHLPFGR